jgi:hypothetical protein
MQSKQYRLMRRGAGWGVMVTHGLLDTEWLAGGRV